MLQFPAGTAMWTIIVLYMCVCGESFMMPTCLLPRTAVSAARADKQARMCQGSQRPATELTRRALLFYTFTLPLTLGSVPQRASAQLYVPSDGSELAPIVKDGKPSPVVLVPLLQAQAQLDSIAKLIESNDLDSWREASKTLGQKPFTPNKELKRLFNAYSDNIYFSDPSRKNMYLDGSAMLGAGTSTYGFGTLSVGAGGASPESKDTFTYLYRNEVLNNVDALTAELAYLIRQSDAGVEEASDDLFLYLKRARDNFDKYLANIPDEDLQKARNYVKATVGSAKRK